MNAGDPAESPLPILPGCWNVRRNTPTFYGQVQTTSVEVAISRKHCSSGTTPVTAGRGTAPDGSPIVVPILGTRNAERYPSYTRIDARVERLFRAGRQRVRLFVNAANLLDANNVCCTTDFELVNAGGEAPRFVPDDRQGLGRTISLGVTWEFGGGQR